MDIHFINNKSDKLNINNKKIVINIQGLSYLEINKTIEEISPLFPKTIKIKFIGIGEKESEIILLILDNYTFNYKNPRKLLLEKKFQPLIQEVDDYKRITISPNKVPKTMAEYFLKKIPKNYTFKKFPIKKKDRMFPLSSAVNQGSSHRAFFLHIFPRKINPKYDNIFLIGKCVTFDSGGLDLKLQGLPNMKTDMAGSAILIAVLNLVHDTDKNIHLLIPIVENFIGSEATLPGTVITTLSGKTVEITNMDGEGRLCIADSLEYFNKFLYKKNLKNPVIIDIATLTANTKKITCGVSFITTCNSAGKKYDDLLLKIGEEIAEYGDYLKLRENYLDKLTSKVADIKNSSDNCKAGFLIASAFINYFVDPKIPWMHIDIDSVAYVDEKVNSIGVNLLRNFILQL